MAATPASGGGTGVCFAADALAGYVGTSANMQIAAAGGKIYLVNNTTALSSTHYRTRRVGLSLPA